MSPLILLAMVPAQGSDLHFIAEGMTRRLGGYSPIRAEMTPTAPAGQVSKSPVLKAPIYGQMKFGDKSFMFILDEPDGAPASLYLDANGNGDLTDDAKIEWTGKQQGQFMMYQGTGKVSVHGTMAGVNFYRFDKNDPNRAALKNTLLFYGDFGYEGKVTIGPKAYSVQFAGEPAANQRLWIDRNGNGKSDGRSESVVVGKPFNFDGVSYVLSVKGAGFQCAKSDQSVAEYKLPPNLAVGQIVPSFEAVTTDGTKISFPKSYAGKIVMLDFWATWCGPCIAEMPNVIAAYDKYHSKGFEILGISFDQANAAEKLASFTKEKNMPWMQVYEGKYWDTVIGQQFGVEGIPFGLVVDGSTGRILANSPRGAALEKVLETAFAGR